MNGQRELLMRILKLYSIILFIAACGFAQGLDDPLQMQGIDHTSIQSAVARATGGITIGVQNDASIMFANPAALQSLKGIQIVVGGMNDYVRAQQVQQYAPLKYYSNFSLLMEGLTGYIGNPDTSLGGSNAGDTVQRPFDNIGPNWYRTKHVGSPVQIFVGIPFTLGERQFAVGAGAVEYANLNHFYQNNNVLSPAIGSERPIPTPLPTTDSLPVQWYQYLREREGSIHGYGLALSGNPTDNLSVGLSALILKGSTDDYEQHTGRGTLIFFPNYFRLDSVYNRTTSTGTSDYSGAEFTLSGIYRGRNIKIGFSLKPPTTITRSFTANVRTDTAGGSARAVVTGEDKMQFPWRGSIGISMAVRENISVGLEYEIRSFASAIYTNNAGTESNPWASASVLHLGAEFCPVEWLALRGGMRKQAEVFEPAGNPLVGDPVSYTIYSTGVGVSLARVHVNLAYEFGLMKYDDAWQSNVNLNSEWHHAVSGNIVYDLPWSL